MDSRAIEDNIVAELYFLITKFLANGPLKHVGEVLIAEIEKQKILPPRIDWTGDKHDQTYAELERKYSHIGPNHLLQICARITTLLDKDMPPSVAGISTLLGAGRQSTLRTIDTCAKPKSVKDYCARFHSMPLLSPINRKYTHNIVKVLYGRESAGPLTRKLAVTNDVYSKKQLLRRTLGHLSAVYCVLFDRTGKYIITGADDLLVKLWSAIDGRLLFTFRGASAEITDIAINLENTLLAAGSLDHILRVWDLQTASPIAVLCCHTGMITSVNFCPSPRDHLKYLVTTSTDGSVAFWQYVTSRDGKTTFASKPTQYLEKIRPGQAQMIYASFSPGGLFLAAGSADHNVRVYNMADEGPKRILEVEAHSDTVDSIQWAHNSLRFVSGSKDGTALVWHFESQQWKSMRLEMSERLPTCPVPTEDNKKLKVTMVGWDLSDKFVVTAVNDFSIKVWNADTGKLHRVMRGHTDELYVLESHPKDPHILISAGHDGKLFIWDVMDGVSLASFTNQIDGQGHGGVFDAKWSPDGTMIAATDSHGHILMYGFGSGHKRLKELPSELFFHTDYRPLIRDSNHYVMDEQTQTVPHLMPPPFLVDVDGNPYPPSMQRLVPGRESCTADQLVPNISVGPEGVEVVEGPNAVSHIDRLIAALVNRQGPGGVVDAGIERNGNILANANPVVVLDNLNIRGGNIGGAYQEGISPAAAAAAAASNRLNNVNGNNANNNAVRSNANRVAVRRTAEIEGVRQSSGNWQRSQIKWLRRQYIKPMQPSRLQILRQTVYHAGQQELEHYRREIRRRPIMISTSSPNSSMIPRALTNLRGRRIGRTRSANTLRASGAGNAANAAPTNSRSTYRTRAVRTAEQRRDEDEEDDHSVTSASSDSSDGTVAEDQISSGSSSSDSQSSDYSDWVGDAEQSTTLEPPKRSKRKRVKPRSYSPTEESNSQSNNSRIAGRRLVPLGENGEIPETYRPPEWLSEVIPRKTPYYPQMGDEVVYFRQGHKLYLEAVQQKNVYKLAANCEPWSNLDLRDCEFVKVIGIKYEIRPPRLCCLKLALINNDGTLAGDSFTIKYHDIPDVLDFLVLKQTYDTAVRRLWSPGDRFRCMIDDGWWIGQITQRVALSADFPDSLFLCFQIRWDSGETEKMSPWDMEPIDNSRLPPEVGGVVHVQSEELQAMLYHPASEEWPRGDRDGTCRRIVAGLEEVMGLAIADPFLAPVDLNIYPTYAFIVEYPIDLTTIKSRFENHFYRRIASAQFDVRYLATNAEKFNQSDSHIVRHARIITDLCLRIIKDHNEVDVNAVYHQLQDTYQSDSDDTQQPGTSTGGVTPAGRRRSRRNVNSSGGSSGSDWRSKCRQVFDIIWNHDDSAPFREPVDTIEHPDYLQIVDTPMDLRTIKEDLIGGNYESANEFFKDMRIIFVNSRAYNTNKRSRIYAMTFRLNNLFEEQVKTIFKRSSSKTARPGRSTTSRRNASSTSQTMANGGPSTSRQYTRVRRITEDEEVDIMNGETPSTSTGRTRRTVRSIRNQSNGVSSSFTSEATTPGTSGRAVNSKRRRIMDDDDDDDEEEESEMTSGSETSDDDSDESSVRVGDSAAKSAVQRKHNRHSDSEESYNPIQPKSIKKYKRKKNGQNNRKLNGTPKRSRRLLVSDDEDEAVDEPQSQQNGRQNGGNTRQSSKRGRTRRSHANRITSEEENEQSEEEEIENSENDEQESHEEEEQEEEDEEEQNSEEEVEEEDQSRSRRRRTSRKYDSDQTYRQSPSPNRTRRGENQSNESDTVNARPTRSATKRDRLRWAQEEDSLEEPNDEDDADGGSNEVVSRKPTSSQSVSTSSQRNASVTQHEQRIRTRRQLMQENESAEEDVTPLPRSSRLRRQANNLNQSNEGAFDDDDSDDEVLLSQLANNQGRPKRNFRKATTTTSTTTVFVDTTSTTQIQQNGNSLPHTRDLIRRRQASMVSATNSSSSTSASTSTQNHSRYHTTRSSISTTTSASQLEIQRNQVHEDHNYMGEPGPSTLRHSRRLTQLSRHQRNPDELDKPLVNSEIPIDPLRLPDQFSGTVEPISGRLRNRTPRNNRSNDNIEEDDSDPDDDKPLHDLIESPRRARSSLRQQTHYSDDNAHVSASQPGPSNSTLSARSVRSLKRPYYNENSDDDDYSATPTNHRTKRRMLAQSSQSRQSESASTHRSTHPRREVHRSHYFDDATSDSLDENDSDDDGEQQISVSSRGRVRKISSKIGKYR